MVDYKSKYLEMKLKYINAKQLAGTKVPPQMLKKSRAKSKKHIKDVKEKAEWDQTKKQATALGLAALASSAHAIDVINSLPAQKTRQKVAGVYDPITSATEDIQNYSVSNNTQPRNSTLRPEHRPKTSFTPMTSLTPITSFAPSDVIKRSQRPSVTRPTQQMANTTQSNLDNDKQWLVEMLDDISEEKTSNSFLLPGASAAEPPTFCHVPRVSEGDTVRIGITNAPEPMHHVATHSFIIPLDENGFEKCSFGFYPDTYRSGLLWRAWEGTYGRPGTVVHPDVLYEKAKRLNDEKPNTKMLKRSEPITLTKQQAQNINDIFTGKISVPENKGREGKFKIPGSTYHMFSYNCNIFAEEVLNTPDTQGEVACSVISGCTVTPIGIEMSRKRKTKLLKQRQEARNIEEQERIREAQALAESKKWYSIW